MAFEDNILCAFAPQVGGSLGDGGTLLLSGILNTRLAAVKATYTAAGYRILRAETLGEWCALALSKA
ncbi:MAG: 50S ribosomal protein L11 methyltransferase [Clostridiales bacterium]|nr:50S ribosomal protein L11 methyltransferase [Clostridiales bacterium]